MVKCEEFVNKILPYVRVCFVKKLKEKGLSQKEIAEKLGISQPLVSMYLNDKRGKEINQKLKEKVKRIVRKQKELRICPICKKIDDLPRQRNCY